MATNYSEIRLQAESALESAEVENIATAVRQSLDWFAQQNPGRAVELRVPPFRVVQVLGGTTHRRGTPPAIVEMKPEIWLKLIAGQTDWSAEVTNGSISASGERSNLGEIIAATISD